MKRMSILLIFENKDVKPWLKELKMKIPNTLIEVYPKVKKNESVDFIICWRPKKDVFENFLNVKIVQSVGASIDHITNSQKINKEIIVSRIIDKTLSNDMWEFLITIVMAELKNRNIYLTQEANKIWQQHSYKTINKTTISILGLGKIGSFVAEKFSQIGFKVKGWSNSKKDILNVDSYYEENEFDTFLADSDFLINLLPLTKNTANILNKKVFEKLPNNAFLINVGRGEHLVENDLLNALEKGDISGALLDVFRKEPLPKNHPFWNHSKIKITPHVASLTDVEQASNQISENYKRFINRETLLNTVSLKKGY